MELLVSVRNATEAAVVAQHQVAIVDIKEPANGALGMPDPTVVTEILKQLPVDQTVSLALGELADLTPEKVRDYFSRCKIPQPEIFAKIGLAGMNDDVNWPAKWGKVLNSMPDKVNHVAVAYADYSLAQSPLIDVVLKTGVRHGCQAMLLDTFTKTAGGSLDHVSLDELQRHLSFTNANGIRFVLAGSITSNVLSKVVDLNIDLIGVRGAVCESGVRTSSISIVRLREFLSELDEFSNRESAQGYKRKVVSEIT